MRFSRNYLMFAFILTIPVAAFADDLGLARLSMIEGEVQVLIQDTTDWTEAAINLPLNERDRIWVAEDGKAELQIRGGVYTRADSNTALDVLTVTADTAQFYLDRGHVYINDRRGGIKTVQVDTPQSSIRSYDDSIMMIDVSEDGITEVSVLKGFAYAESRSGATRVSAGSTLTIRGEDNADLAPVSSPDEWERWNMDRDRRLSAWGESSRYLPGELHEYSSDFDENGRWEYAADYGYVWTPAVVAAGWAPYTVGSWIWIHGNYVWVAHDPWCWAPCHYGRWVFIPAYGWSWVPPSPGAVYWGPGYVGWIVTPSYVAWVPLAPGEIFYGYGYYGPWSRNITTVGVNTVVVNQVFVNARVNNAVVVVQRESFGTGRHLPVKVRENPFVETRRNPAVDIAIVPPRVKPQQPVVIAPPRTAGPTRRPPEPDRMQGEVLQNRRVVPPAPAAPAVRPERPADSPSLVRRPSEQQPLPPERFRRIRPEEFKNERRVIKDRDASVFKTAPPENLPVRKMREPRVIIRKPVPQPGGQPQPQKKTREEEKERRTDRER
jgi:FecR protein